MNPIRLGWLCLVFGLPLTERCGGETLRIRADTWMPFNGDPKSPTPGYAVEILHAIFDPQGFTLDYELQPWGESLKAAKAGEVEAVIGADRLESDGLVIPTEPVGISSVGLLVRQGNPWHYESVHSLAGIRLGVILDYKYWRALDTYIAQHTDPEVLKFSGIHPLADGLTQLKSGALDVFVETSSVFYWAVKTGGYTRADFKLAYLQGGDPAYVVFSANERGRRAAKLFDAGIAKLRGSGQLRQILARYGQRDWKEETASPTIPLAGGAG